MTTRHGPRRFIAALATSALVGTGALAAVPLPASAAPDDLAAALLASVDRQLGVTFDQQDTTVRRGDQFKVSGRIGTLTDGLVASLDDGVAAAFTLQITDPAGRVLGTQEITAGPLGAFSTTVPGSVTEKLAASDRPVVLAARAVDATFEDLAEDDAGATAVTVAADDTALQVENSFVSAVGWVKPGEEYPSRIIVKNPATTAVTDVKVTVQAAAVGSDFVGARSTTGSVSHTASTVTWTIPSVPAAADATTPSVSTLILEHAADTLAEEPTLVWRDLSTTATVTAAGATQTLTSHGPRVIPPGEQYDTARYGDRPFPVVPVDYLDKKHQDANTGALLESKLNSDDPTDEIGSTFELFQEMSLGQLFPEGTVPSADLATAGWDYEPGFPFTNAEPAGTCTGVTMADSPAPTEGTPLYAERVTNGWYQLPGTTSYYGGDKFGTAVVGALTGVGALMDIDSACGPTGKMVWDAAAIADPEIDYSDYDTDKDGVVDFFMAVFAGCGGNGASQLGVAACPYPTDAVPSDNIWPHSSSLEYYYTDAETGQPGFVTDDQLKDYEGNPLFYTSAERNDMTTTTTEWPVMVRVGPYNVNPETAIGNASVISHEYGHSLGLPDFYSLGGRETYGDWNLMATDKSQHMDVFSRVEMGWVVPEVLDGDRTVEGMTDSKEDTHRIVWQRPDGTPYELTGPDVHNSQAFVAKLPGRKLIDESIFDSGEKASKTHAWWSGSGNDFGCAPEAGRNLDLAIPGLADLPAGTPVTLSFKSAFDIEWDFDYGFVLASTDGGKSWASQESENGTTTANTPPLGNPNTNGCQAKYGNGITGTSGSYAGGSEQLDRLAGEYPPMEFISDSFDISELAGSENPVLRFSYATDPGLARPGWFVDDLKVVATVDGAEKVLLESDFESDGGPDDPRIFNGGCQEDFNAAGCTKGWNYVEAGAEALQDHAYLLELRDRSGFDFDGRGENDRDEITFQPGLSMVYTDEAHGYGNTGTDNPPAQSPLDANPEPGSDTPDLSDAAWKKGGKFTDSGEGHTDNYTDPSNTEVDSRYADEPNPWRFRYDCLGFEVLDMTGDDVGPEDPADGNLTANVRFDMGAGCGDFDPGYEKAPTGPEANTAPSAAADAKPAEVRVGQEVIFDATDTTDAETPDDLDFVWDFGDGGSTKDAAGVVATRTYAEPGTYTAKVTVTDPQGLTDDATVEVEVTEAGPDGNASPVAKASASRKHIRTDSRVRLSSKGSSDAETPAEKLTYEWDFDNGGSDVDSTARNPRVRFAKPGVRVVTLTVTDADGAQDTDRVRIKVRKHVACESKRVKLSKGWRERTADRARGDRYCMTPRKGTLRMRFEGPQVDVLWGKARRGGSGTVFVDGKKVGRLVFKVGAKKPVFKYREKFRGLGAGPHVLRIKTRGGAAYIDELRVYR